MREKYDVVIIGSGPAGLTAAIYSARARLKTVVIAGQEFGGQLMGTTLVENFPGFPEGIMGPELMMNMVKQAENQGAQLVYKLASSVSVSDDEKVVTADGIEYEAKAVIVSVGSSPRKLDIPGEKEFWGKGVSTCATCDGAFYKDKVVAVVGGGDSAAEEVTFLTKFVSKAYLIVRRDEMRASKAMQERVHADPKIEVIWNSEVKEVVGKDSVDSLAVYNNKEDSMSELEVDGIFLAIGHIPNSQLLADQVELDEMGFVKVSDRTMTSVPGVFVSGDVHDHHYQQAITAAGMGCMSAIDAERWLASQTS